MGEKLLFLLSLVGYSKQTGDERNLFHDVPFFHATHLTLPKHVDGFIAL